MTYPDDSYDYDVHKGRAFERELERADRLRDERKDRQWEKWNSKQQKNAQPNEEHHAS